MIESGNALGERWGFLHLWPVAREAVEGGRLGESLEEGGPWLEAREGPRAGWGPHSGAGAQEGRSTGRVAAVRVCTRACASSTTCACVCGDRPVSCASA